MKKILLAIVVSLGLAACTQVETGQRGVVKQFGKVTDVKGEGLVWYNPLTTDIVPIDIRQIKWEGQTVAYTKDVQQADVAFTLTYRLQPDKVREVYTRVGENWASAQIPQVVEQIVKDIFGKSEAVNDAINNRGAVQARILAALREGLAPRHVIVEGFELRDISFSAAFEKAVEAKQVAVENANAARNKTVQIQEQARQKVITAEADAKAMQIKAQALAANPALVQYEAVLAWDGKLPQNMYGNSVPFVQVR